MNNKSLEKLIRSNGTPIYIYKKSIIKKNYESITNLIPYDDTQIHYAVMCNDNADILLLMKELGASLQINSFYELSNVRNLGFNNNQISFTSTGLSTANLKTLIQNKITLNLDSLEEVEKYCSLNPGGKFGIRVKMDKNIELPENHTNSPKDSDIGISPDLFPNIQRIANESGCKINGVHGYLASNILTIKPLMKASDYLVEYAKKFPDLEYINFGSGFGVSGKLSDNQFDFKKIGLHYATLTKKLSERLEKRIQLKIEPGRSIVATAGTLYATVMNVKKLKDKKQLIIDAGFAEFARPRIYGAYHDVKVVGKEGSEELYDIRSNTVLQSDFIGRNRYLPSVEEEDIISIHNAGAYGAVMASGFPGKHKPKELLLE